MSIENERLLAACAVALSLALGACGTEVADGTDATAAGAPAAATSTSHSFNTATGTLNVDYGAYLSKHDVVFNSPITTPSNGPTVATGRIGAQVWNSNGLTMQVTGVDNAQQTAFSSGLVNLRTSPAMDSGYSTFQQRLSLYDGTVTATYDANRTVTVMGVPGGEVFGIHVDDARSGVSSVTLDLSIWDLSGLPSSSTSMYLDVPSMGTWKTVSTFADSTGAGFSRGQSDANGFGYTLAASVEGAGYSASVVNGSTVRLTITPTSSYTIWIANATRKNAPNGDSVAQARRLLSDAKSSGYAATLAAFKDWWHGFWNASFVQYGNATGDADYLENFYYLSEHTIAGGAFGNYPFQHVHGTYSAKKDDAASQWSGGYWFWNERDVYHSFLASNHASVLDGFYNLYLRNYDVMKSHTQSRFGIDGIWVPETIGWDGNARHTDESDFTKNIFTTGDEAAQWMYYRYKYTNDAAWLSKIYPFMREVAKFHAAKFSRDGSGRYYMASSNSHETYWNVKDALTDLVAVKAYFPMVIEASAALGQDSSLRTQWQNVLSNLQPYPADGNGYLPMDPPVAGTHNNENIACEMAWPYGVVGVGSSDVSRVVYNWNTRPFPHTEIWSPDAIQAARLGMGDQAFSSMKTMLGKWQAFPNGMTNTWNGVYDVLGTHLSAINEALMQSHTGKIRVFPAVPSDSSFVGKFTLLAYGGFLVSSEREGGEIKYVGLKSLAGRPATVVNPWGTQQVQVRNAADDTIVLASAASELTFNTAAGGVYVVERTAKPLGSYGYVQLTGTANQGQKALSGTSARLGAGTGSGPTSYTLTVSRAGSGGGTVSGGAISCGNTCSATLAVGTTVTLTATPAAGSTFGGWAGACSGTGTCTVTMNAPQAVTASFTVPLTSGVSINAGGAASGAFVADAYYAGGSTYSTTTAIDTTGIPGSAPAQSVFQTERYGEFTYTIPGLTAGNPYTVTLYFAETYWTAAGQRTFNVAINGATVLTAFDIFAAAGGTAKAVARTFSTTADASGQVVIAFTKGGGPDNPKVCGIAVAEGGTTYTLGVTTAGTGSGTVAGGPINCGATCSATLASGTTVTLTATPATGSTFAGWAGSCSGTSATCTLTMSAARSVTATFNGPASATLTVTKGGSGTGTVTGGGISCGSTCAVSVAGGSSVTLTAVADAGSTFAGWGGACSGTGACVVSVSGSLTVTATFTGPQISGLAINAGGAATGTFVADVDYSGGSTYSTTTAIDTSTISGTPPPQAVFQTERYGEFTYTIPGLAAGSAYSVTLYFAETYWTAAGQRTFNVAVNGSTVLSAFDLFAAAGGANKAIARTFNATADASGQIVIAFTKGGGPDNPKVCGIAVAAGGGTSYALGVTTAGTGSGTVAGGPISCGATCSATLASGTAVTLTATPATGSTFAGWSGDCTGSGACVLSMTANRSVTATFNGGTSTGRLLAVQSGRCLDVPNRSQTNGTKLSIWDCNGGTNQQWTQTSSGAFQVYGSKCLELPSGSTAAGTQVQINDCSGATSQQWRFNADGTIASVSTSLCLDVSGGGTANGTSVVVSTCNGGQNQRWSR